MSGLSLEEIDALFQSGTSARKSIAWNREQRAKDHHMDTEKAQINQADPRTRLEQEAASTKMGKMGRDEHLEKAVKQQHPEMVHTPESRVSESTVV